MPHAKLVKSWWPKPKIAAVPEHLWGDRWTNVNSGCMHKFVCYSFSAMGFHPRDPITPGVPECECLAYGESPEQAYDKWCDIFNVWNKEEDWVK